MLLKKLLKCSWRERVKSNMDKGAQIGMWVIFAIAIIVVVALLFAIQKKPVPDQGIDYNPQSYIDGCTRKAVEEVVDKILPQGGFLNPGYFKLYNGTKVIVLCESREFYKTCVSQHPMLLNEIKGEILNYTLPRIEKCFDNLKAELEKTNAKVNYGLLTTSVDLGPERVYLNIKREVMITKNEQSMKFENFNVETVSPIYDLASIAVLIAGEEAKNCYFEYVGYELLHPSYKIDVFMFSDATRIYTLKDKDSGKIMNIATRSCVIKPGI